MPNATQRIITIKVPIPNFFLGPAEGVSGTTEIGCPPGASVVAGARGGGGGGGVVSPGDGSWRLKRSRGPPGNAGGLSTAAAAAGTAGATGVAGQLATQVAKRLGARRVIAVGRNPEALQKLKALGAGAVISLDQDQASLVSVLRSEIAEAGVDVVLDYL